MASADRFHKDDGRHFNNTSRDFDPGHCPELADSQVSEDRRQAVRVALDGLLEHLRRNLPSLDADNETVYTGLAGVAYMYWQLAQRETAAGRRDELLQTAIRLVTPALAKRRQRRVSFLCGDPGPTLTGLLTGARADSREQQVKELLAMRKLANDSRTPDEVLYGRAGFLYALLVARQLGVLTGEVDDAIKDVAATMLRSGVSLAGSLKQKSNRPPLMFEWHDSFYLGAAHGIVGILYLLLQVPPHLLPSGAVDSLIRPTVDWLMTLRFPSANCPSSWGKETDKLVHWCHGAPGWVYMFLRAYELWKEEKYLACALDCGEVIWARGLLHKGYGLCHGVAGNGYAFLALHRATGQQKQLYRAVKFAEFCCDFGQHGCRAADRPFSLYEGLAGTICFLQDVLNPNEARFPGFEL